MHFKKNPKTYLFSGKTDISKNVLFWSVYDLCTKLLTIYKPLRVWHSGIPQDYRCEGTFG